jgi:methylmalonyl-CoA/ethylmalonyl-CoA epimerase
MPRLLWTFIVMVFCAAPQPATAQERGFAQIGMRVTDLERAVAFYSQAVGLPLLFRAGDMVFFKAGDARLMVEEGEPGRTTVVYFEDDNLERNKPLMEARGIKFTGPVETVQRTKDYDLKLLVFHDPDGNTLALMGQVPR